MGRKNKIPCLQAGHRLLAAAAWSLISCTALAAQAEEIAPFGQLSPNVRVTGDARVRYESWDFFRTAPAVNNQNAYDFWAIRARLGVLFESSLLNAFVQGEAVNLQGLPANSTARPGGPLGLGALYHSESADGRSPADVHLKQAYVQLKMDTFGVGGLALKGGRFEMMEGMEVKTGEAKFDQLRTTRISQRLLGNFDFTHAPRNFDGGMADYDQKAYHFTTSLGHPTQGGFNINAGEEIPRIDIAYAALVAKKDQWLPGTEARLFYLYYGDNRHAQVLDNRPTALRPFLNQSALAIHNVGTHWLATKSQGPGEIDALFWGVYQFGDWGNLHHRAYAVTAEGGYQLKQIPFKPWLRGGYFRGSGDDNPQDKTHGTFFAVLPTVRLYAKFPFFNQMNLNDGFVQFILSPTDTLRVGVDYHHLSLAEAGDLSYSGAGATSASGSFGYLGRPSNGKTDVGQLVDLTVTYQLTKTMGWHFYYGHAFGGDVLKSFYNAKSDADYAFVDFSAGF